MLKSKISVALAFAPLAAFGAPPPGQFAYATNYRQELMRIDMQSSTTQLIGNIGFAAQGLAATSTGRLYATNNSGKLYDVTGATVTPIANLGALDVGAMDSRGTTLWGYDNNSQRLFEYDPVSTSFVQWSSVLGISNVKALAINSAGDFLFVSNGATDKFGKITNGTWSVSLINNNMGLADHCEAMDFLPDGNLYAAVLQDYRYKIDPLTGSAISGFNSGVHRDWADMTGTPVPEPGTLLLVVAGIGFLSRAKRRA